MIRMFGLFLALICISAAHGQITPVISGSSTPDPYTLTATYFQAANNPITVYGNRVGKTQVDCTVSGTTTGVIVVFGQSLAANYTNDSYAVTNTNLIQDFSNLDGGCYLAKYPSIGTTYLSGNGTFGSYLLRLGDAWVTAGNFTRVIFANAAIGGSLVSDWATGALAQNITATFRRLQAAKLTVTAVVWEQGENDCSAGTSQANYASSLATVISNIRTFFPAGPIFINQESWVNGTACSAITTAQANAVNHASGIWAGANIDSITATGRQADNTHLNSTGAASAASALQTAMHAFGAPF
jgi:hypothetical protein